jgi:hypothetical protein
MMTVEMADPLIALAARGELSPALAAAILSVAQPTPWRPGLSQTGTLWVRQHRAGFRRLPKVLVQRKEEETKFVTARYLDMPFLGPQAATRGPASS